MRTAENLASHELIGLHCSVPRSTSKTYAGISGVVVDETKNTFVLEKDGGKEVRIPKQACAFAFEAGGHKVGLDGKELKFLPEDRVKKCFKVRGRIV